MSAGVFTPDLRVAFVDGQERTIVTIDDGFGGTYEEYSFPDAGFVHCGDFTDFPMEVTGATIAEKLDKIAEVYYRVKDAKFIAGAITGTFDPPRPAEGSITAPSTIPSTKTSGWVVGSAGGGFAHRRGYTTKDADIPAHHLPYLSDPYLVGESYYARDAINERGMWLLGDDFPIMRPIWNVDIQRPYDQNATSAFNFRQTGGNLASTGGDYFVTSGFKYVDGSFPYEYTYEDRASGVGIFFSNRVAVLKVNPADGFFAPTNRFFIGVSFRVLSFNGVVSMELSSRNDYPPSPPSGPNYTLRLSSGDISCPLRESYGMAVVSSYSDFIHKATEWWPYAKDSPAVPVWDTTNGAKL